MNESLWKSERPFSRTLSVLKALWAIRDNQVNASGLLRIYFVSKESLQSWYLPQF